MDQARLEQICWEFFENFWIPIESMQIHKEEWHIFFINIQSPDSALLIGMHGKNLEAFSQIIKLIAQKETKDAFHIRLEVNDYLKQKDEKLYSFIDKKIHIALEKQTDVELPFLDAYERKKVHNYVAQKENKISTESRWEGKERRMYLCYKAEKISIDLDGDAI